MVDETKLRTYFPNTTVYKDQRLMTTFKEAAIPAFLRDWILKKKAGVDGKINDTDSLRQYVKTIIPQKEDKLTLTDEARSYGESRKFLARIDIRFNIASNSLSFAISDLDIQHSDTLIEEYVWNRIKNDVINTSGGWGLIQLGYLPPSKGENPKGKITLVKFKNFCPYTVNLDVYREARSHFTIEEWVDILLGAIDYNPDGYDDFVEKHTVLTRLLPFIEPRLNLIELAPKGTGKSYLFGTIGKYGWLVSGGSLTRAKLFYDIQKKQDGLVKNNDFVAMDEIQSIHFPDPSEMQGALKAYMEAGEATFGDQHVVGSAGIILLGNIPQNDMNVSANMFRSLPTVFQESALLDRFHGFIQGYQIPRMSERLKVNGWALNTEYFSEIMHLMRSQSECILYRSVIEELIEYPSNADTRDTQAILRICTAYLKLFFPHVTKADQINIEEFKRLCFYPAIEMRRIIRNQLQIIDPEEFRGKNLAAYSIKSKYDN
ncbi:MAG: BREX system Lon protease-like protein BrxL [Thermoguttaceae bacterium]|nr:BREX system Lon protease-like protein BrxL [Thermoguttaceae bacterium]